ncbi:cyclic nucleotide-binding domain-containing protein [Kitasatospora sp. NBC_01287]|uniref:cyclic nucleotide-binding domain-containing protein n=1 Tax=Kitasatospora sp. NBC_01287 TaxID=2903573 RepID=UPI00225117C2|nr:cyclic nucleotide-binding domain-containing protein [Kitasatospora sp. NBC_01287]MCX4744784.1 cyclic nucleotide-binding domain-containing protein [Kitasatospora sp. NBC_01287]
MTTAASGFLAALAPAHRARLLGLAREVSFPAGVRLFEEDGAADRFWIVRSGSVALDIHVPGRRGAVVETLGEGELLGWSWLFEPYRWHLGAQVRSALLAAEFDAPRVRAACADDPAFGLAITHGAARVIARRLKATRTRLLDLYGPPDTGAAR